MNRTALSPGTLSWRKLLRVLHTAPSEFRRAFLSSFSVAIAIAAAAAADVEPTSAELRQREAWVAAHWLGDLPLAARAGPLVSDAALPFSFRYDGQPSAEWLKDRTLTRTRRQLDAQRVEHVLTYRDDVSGFEVRCVAIEYRAFATVEWTLYFRNGGAADTAVLQDIRVLDLAIALPVAGACVLHHTKGDDCAPDSYEPRALSLAVPSEHRFAPAGGRPTNRAFPYFNLEWPGGGVIAVLGWPGQWSASFRRDEAGRLRVEAGQEQTHFRLRPGEEVRSPLAVVQFWSGDRVRSQNLWRRWMLAHNLPRTPQGALPSPMFTSCSGGFFPGLRCNEADERRFIDAFTAAGIKLDYWWMDAGWYPCGDGWPNVGTWAPDRERFSAGLKPISDHARSQGMGLILWFEPERVTPGTQLYLEHPQWLLGRDGETKLLNLGDAAARQWLTDHVSQLITTQGLAVYRQDFNMDPLNYWRSQDAPDRQGITEIRHVTGYLAYWDELRRRHPGLWIDSCASGGRRNDLETLRRAMPLLRSDYQSFEGDPGYAPGNQGHTYGLAPWIPYFGQGVYYNPRQFAYSARSSWSPAFGLCADVRGGVVDWAAMRRIAEQWRRVAPCYLGDFYPLTPYTLDATQWIAWQFDLPEKGEGMVQAFRRDQSIYEAACLKLRALEPEARYALTSLDTGETQSLTGRQACEDGYHVAIPQRGADVAVHYRKLKP